LSYHDDEPDESEENAAEFPDESDMDSDDHDEDTETIPCPACGKPIYDQTERCPYCGQYVTTRFRPPMWVIVGAVICIIIVAIWCLR
jgi:DNA-directed RNA polymerase subunit RPC12/RpoP